jgi:hypothetical protein
MVQESEHGIWDRSAQFQREIRGRPWVCGDTAASAVRRRGWPNMGLMVRPSRRGSRNADQYLLCRARATRKACCRTRCSPARRSNSWQSGLSRPHDAHHQDDEGGISASTSCGPPHCLPAESGAGTPGRRTSPVTRPRRLDCRRRADTTIITRCQPTTAGAS